MKNIKAYWNNSKARAVKVRAHEKCMEANKDLTSR